MTHYWIQTWQGLCVYYITRHQAHLSFITYIPPPHQEREKGEWEVRRRGNIDLTPSHVQRLLFLQVRTILCSQLSVTQLFLSLSPSSLLFFTLPAFCAGNLLNITTQEHPRRSSPQGLFGEILETHQRSHPTLLSSHTDGTNHIGWFDSYEVV